VPVTTQHLLHVMWCFHKQTVKWSNCGVMLPIGWETTGSPDPTWYCRLSLSMAVPRVMRPSLLFVFGCATQQAVPPEKPGQQSDFEELCENLRIKKPRRVLITDPATKLSQRDISFMLIAVLLFGTGLLLFESCFSLDSIALATFR